MRIPTILALGLATAASANAQIELPSSLTAKSKQTDSRFEFHAPELLRAGGEPIFVESPGYAAPCLHDIDGDGDLDLLVGQFREGKIQVFEGAGKGELEAGRWLEADGDVAIVPGVW